MTRYAHFKRGRFNFRCWLTGHAWGPTRGPFIRRYPLTAGGLIPAIDSYIWVQHECQRCKAMQAEETPNE